MYHGLYRKVLNYIKMETEISEDLDQFYTCICTTTYKKNHTHIMIISAKVYSIIGTVSVHHYKRTNGPL